MRILLLNWRDPAHPRAGGAEYFTHGIAKRLVQRGHAVTWIAGAFDGAPAEIVLDGIRIIRAGGAVSVRIHAQQLYRSTGPFDVVIDEINTLPFFTPLYARVPVVALINQLAREIWFYEAPWPVAAVGYAIEPLYLQAYRRVPILTISQSTADSLRKIGLRGPVEILPVAIEHYPAPIPLSLEERDDVIICLGRVTRSKRIDHTMRALALATDGPLRSTQLLIVGAGDDRERRRLERVARQLGIIARVEWKGHVAEEQKRSLLHHARALVMTSAREGWGLAVSEANLAGTPAVVYDVPGSRDAVRQGETGFRSAPNAAALSRVLGELLTDPQRYLRVAMAAQGFARTLTWDATMAVAERALLSWSGM